MPIGLHVRGCATLVLWKDNDFVIPIVNAKLLTSEFDQQLNREDSLLKNCKAEKREASASIGAPGSPVETSMLNVFSGSASLPHGTGAALRVAGFAEGRLQLGPEQLELMLVVKSLSRESRMNEQMKEREAGKKEWRKGWNVLPLVGGEGEGKKEERWSILFRLTIFSHLKLRETGEK
ncbi:unnamed protein product [Ilex paraguariensis]|uniref:Uncharacterized protein n=1 Tax=Ilex paraguariensis TaxID=185542 RepID=A0ABC8S4W8_9AQUA